MNIIGNKINKLLTTTFVTTCNQVTVEYPWPNYISTINTIT